ncbi:hypothetical protein OAJ96_00395 [bacterium]|nr:hypothetical protein [bacterium]
MSLTSYRAAPPRDKSIIPKKIKKQAMILIINIFKTIKKFW